jgi:hypothetical protein
MHTTFSNIKVGQRVTIFIPNGRGRNGVEYKEATGRAVIVNHARGTVALNMGGRYGTPGVATPENFVRATGK